MARFRCPDAPEGYSPVEDAEFVRKRLKMCVTVLGQLEQFVEDSPYRAAEEMRGHLDE